ncbi:MAG: tetratricopeptide repeat protein [Actinomycetota bacterium]
MERRTFLETMVGAAFLPRALTGLSLEDFLHEPRRYLTAWATTPTRELVPPALGCLWLAEASGSDQAACEASILLAWLAYDLGEDARMRQHYLEAASYASASRGDSAQLLTYALLSWAQDTNDGPAAARLVEQARATLPDDAPPALRQYVNKEGALAWSKVGDSPRATDALARLEPAEPAWPLVFSIGESTVARSHGLVAFRLGRSDTALPLLRQKLEAYGTEPNKHKAYVMEELGRAYRQAGDHEQARQLVAEAREIGGKLGLRRLSTAS